MTAPSSYLGPFHTDHLRASGLSDASIAGRGYQTAQFKQDLTARGFSDWQAKQVPGLLIPIYDVYGELRLWQVRPDTPPLFEGKPLKYLTPKGQPLCLDVPRSVQTLLSDTSIPLWITEGSKKVDAAVQQGLACIGALGVSGWMRQGEPLPDWKAISLRGRQVFIAFDADARQKVPVWRALHSLQTFLRGQGATPFIVSLPDDPHDAKKKIGLDDYLIDHSVEELKALASSNLCPCPSLSSQMPSNPLEKLRFDAFKKHFGDVAEVDAHGGMNFQGGLSLEEIEKRANQIAYFYGRIDDMKKWDLIDVWRMAEPHVQHGEQLKWKQKNLGPYARLVGNVISAIGNKFAANVDNCRRPWLPVWLHAAVRDLSTDDQTTIFDSYESNGGRMKAYEVEEMIDKLTGRPPKEKGKKPGGASRPELDWEVIARQVESGARGGEVPAHIARGIQSRGVDYMNAQMLAIPINPVEEEVDPWEGRSDLYDAPPEEENDDAEESLQDEPQTSQNSDKSAKPVDATSRTFFTNVKFEPETGEVLQNSSYSSIGETPLSPLPIESSVKIGNPPDIKELEAFAVALVSHLTINGTETYAKEADPLADALLPAPSNRVVNVPTVQGECLPATSEKSSKVNIRPPSDADQPVEGPVETLIEESSGGTTGGTLGFRPGVGARTPWD